MTDRPTGPADRIGAKLDADVPVAEPARPTEAYAWEAMAPVGVPPRVGICVRCDQPALDALVLCSGCMEREIDERGRYVRKPPVRP